MNRIMAKTGSPLNTTINHRSGRGVDNKTYGKQKIGTKVHRKTQKTEAEMKVGPKWWSNKYSPQ